MSGLFGASGSGAFGKSLLHVRDEKAAGSDGGTSISGVNTRAINTVVTNEISGASLASNQITLEAGTYHAEIRVPSANRTGAANGHKAYLHNVTDGVDALIGSSAWHDGGTNSGTQTDSFVSGRFTISSTKTFEIRHQITAAETGTGLGYSTNASRIEIYTDAKIWKVK